MVTGEHALTWAAAAQKAASRSLPSWGSCIALLTEETSNVLTMTTWSRMTTEAAMAPHQTAAGL
jgi:hypothetical protein